MSETSPEQAALGKAIREKRTSLGLSQEELGLKAGLDRTYVGGVERGERNPSYASLLRISNALDVKLSTIVALAERLTK